MTSAALEHDEDITPLAEDATLEDVSSESEEMEEAEVAGSSAVDKRAKFKELASKRVTNILNDYRILGKLANPSTYPYTQEDVDKIFGRLESDLAELKEEFQPKKAKDTTFVL